MIRNRPTRAGFTLTEVLVVIGIMITLMGLLMPAITRAYKEAQRAKMATDIQAIVAGLEAYKGQFGDYPPAPGTTGPLNRGSFMLCRALIAPEAESVDGHEGPGFRTIQAIKDANNNFVKQGKPFGPYLDLDKTKFAQYPTGSSPSTFAIMDRYGKPVLYYPKRKNSPGAVIVSSNTNDKPLYVSADNTELSEKKLRALLNVDLSSGQRVAATANAPARSVPFEGPYLLISAGPDGNFGPPADDFISSKNRCDDVTNWPRSEY